METVLPNSACELLQSSCYLTLCFLTRKDHVLMLLREKEPNVGLWNGLGGHIENGETPVEAIRREVQEECGLSLAHFCYGGLLSWESWYFPSGGIFLFTAETETGEVVASNEGKLAWLPVSWILQSDEVVANIRHFLPSLLQKTSPCRWHCSFDQTKLLKIGQFPLPDWAAADRIDSLQFEVK